MAEVPSQFFDDLTQEVRERAEADDLLLPTAFTGWAADLLEDAGVFSEPTLVAFKRTGLQLDGFAIDEENTVLNLVVANHQSRSQLETLPLSEARAHVKRASNFFLRALEGMHDELEESSAAFDAALEIHALRSEIQQLRIIIVTDAVLRKPPEPPPVDGVSVTVDVWDIDRLHRLSTSGRRQEAIRVDLEFDLGTAWPCLEASQATVDDYAVYLALIPGRDLAQIYDRFGPRLLELNVRSFLQARGKVNRGIRDTLLHEPGRFLAYNNGITATASKVRLARGPDGDTAIVEIHELQIVNGGQTSASLHRAMVKDKASLNDVSVMAKITVVEEVERLHELVPLVSRYSNSQNKVSEADFAANDDFHVKVEQLSRSVWAPAPRGGSQLTHWFYERARGQYNDEVGRLRTPAKRRQFREQNPTAQKFTKTDLAKFEHTWAGRPWDVSKGAQKNFLLFQERLVRDWNPTVDEQYFQQLIAKAILFRRTERLVSELQLGGYRANVVTYTLGLLALWTEHRLDLQRIWQQQQLPDIYEDAIRTVAAEVFDIIANPPGGRNVTEWAKTDKCWSAVQQQVSQGTLSPRFWEALAPTRQDSDLRDATEQHVRQARGITDQLTSVTPAAYFAAEVWARQFSPLEALAMRALQNAALAASGDGRLSRRDAERADRSLRSLVAEGFDHADLGPYRRV